MDEQLGLERTPQEYVEKLVVLFREVRRVLRDDGTCWINLGDSYATQGGTGQQGKNGQRADRAFTAEGTSAKGVPIGLKPKDLCGIPWRVAFALQADGWYLRSDIIWAKPNPMPESVTDRPTKSHEYLFLLAKSERYYYDAEAVKEPCQSGASDLRKMEERKERLGGKTLTATDPLYAAHNGTNIGTKRGVGDPAGRNRRSVWTVSTVPYEDAHFATFPPKLPSLCIQAGTSEHGVCAACGAPWDRVERVERVERDSLDCGNMDDRGVTRTTAGLKNAGKTGFNKREQLGWRPTCSCKGAGLERATILDPFMGAGTTALVAARLNRNFLGCELNPEYKAMAERRVAAELSQGKLL